MKILVTGSQGMIGSWVVKRVLEAGHGVRSFDQKAQPPAAFEGKDWEHMPGDIRDMSDVRQAVQGVDAVIHLAAIPYDVPGMREQVLDTNIRGTWNVLLACTEAEVERLVYFSSINALGHAEPDHGELYLPLDDDVPPKPSRTYGLSKHISEEMCQAFCIQHRLTVVSLRPTWVVQPNQPPHPWWGNMPAERRAFFATQDLWSYIDVRDVSEAALLGLTADVQGHQAFLLTADDSHGELTSAELVEKYYQHLPWERVSQSDYLKDFPNRSLVDCSKAKRLLGWQPACSVRDPASGLQF